MRIALASGLALVAVACGPTAKPRGGTAPVASASSASSASNAGAAGRAPVVVALVVDQLAGWVMAERLSALPPDGGFNRLAREGAYVRDMRYMHAATDTAPGHSSLFTGTPPRESGIFGNEVPRGKALVSILRDDNTLLITAAGPQARPGSSLARLRVPTVADELRAKHPTAVIVGLSLKDRGAAFACGRKPTACAWFDATDDAFVTSSAFARELPAWVAEKGGHAAVERARAAPWVLTDPEWVTTHSPTADDQAGEGDLGGMKTTFPHEVRTAAAFRASPFADAVLVDLARAAIRAEYKDGQPFLLEVSFSSHDIVGHAFGPDSWEAWEELRRVDRSIAELLGALDARFPGGYSVILAADHGTVTMPEVGVAARKWCHAKAKDSYQRPCGPSGRLMGHDIEAAMDREAEAALGPGPWVEGIADPYYFLTEKARALEPKRADALRTAIARALVRYDHALERVEPSAALVARCSEAPAQWDESLSALVCRAYPPGPGAGDGYMVPRPGFFFDSSLVVGKGTSHGSPYVYDRSVPLFVRGPGVAAGRREEGGPLHFTAYARMLRALLGLTGESADHVLTSSRRGSP